MNIRTLLFSSFLYLSSSAQNTHNEYFHTSGYVGEGSFFKTNKIIESTISTGQYLTVGDYDADNLPKIFSLFPLVKIPTRRIDLNFLDASSNWLNSMTYVTLTEMSTNTYNNFFYTKDIANTNDGYIICGNTVDGSDQQRFSFLLRVDGAGNIIWYKKYWPEDNMSYLNSVVQTPDGGFMACGYIFDNDARTYGKHARILKTDAMGNEVWTKEVWGSFSQDGDISWSEYEQIVTIDNDRCALIGTANQFLPFSGDILLTIIDKNGAINYNKEIGKFQDGEGNYIRESGKSLFYDPNLNKLTILGSVEWCNSLTRIDLLLTRFDIATFSFDYFKKIGACEPIYSPTCCEKDDIPHQVQVDLQHNTIWTLGEFQGRSILFESDYSTGNTTNAEIFDNNSSLMLRSLHVDQTNFYDIRMVGNDIKFPAPTFNNSTYFVRTHGYNHVIHCNDEYAAFSQSDWEPEEANPWDFDLSRSDVSEQLINLPFPHYKDVLCGSGNMTGIEQKDINQKQISLYPNPASSTIALENVFGEYEIIDITGKIVLSGHIKENEPIDIVNLPTGIYIVKVTEKSGAVFKTKFSKE